MNLKRIKALIEKIQLLEKSMSISSSKTSPVEKDLMLSYIRELYEAALQEKTEETQIEEIVEPVKIKAKKAPAPKIEKISEPDPIVEPKEAEDTVKSEPETPSVDIVEEPETIKKASKSAAKKSANGEIDALFEMKKGNELSDKLASMPIKNLRYVPCALSKM